MILNGAGAEGRVGGDRHKARVLLWSSQGNGTLASSSGVLGGDLGSGVGEGDGGWRGREGEVVDYTSIPSDAPVPQRYLCCHGNGEGQRIAGAHGGKGGGPATRHGEEGRGSTAFQPCRDLDRRARRLG